jgi:hypothetical protein
MSTLAVAGPAVGTITDAVATLGPDLLAIAAVGLGIGVSIFGLKKGYALVRSFIH